MIRLEPDVTDNIRDDIDSFLKSCFLLLLFNGSFQMEINKTHFATMSIGRLETNYWF